MRLDRIDNDHGYGVGTGFPAGVDDTFELSVLFCMRYMVRIPREIDIPIGLSGLGLAGFFYR